MRIHSPHEDPPQLSDTGILIAKWHVIFTSLPMWRDKKNVTITYESLPSTHQLGDLVEYHPSLSSSPNSSKKSIRGVDSIVSPNRTKFQWRGNGWLKLFTSDWQLLALSDDGEFAISYFGKTLFTPQGIDVYARHPEVDGCKEKVKEIIERLKNGEAGETVQKLAEEAFEVVHDEIRSE